MGFAMFGVFALLVMKCNPKAWCLVRNPRMVRTDGHKCYQFGILRNLRLTSKIDWKNIQSIVLDIHAVLQRILMVSMLVCGYLCLIVKETTRDYEYGSI